MGPATPGSTLSILRPRAMHSSQFILKRLRETAVTKIKFRNESSVERKRVYGQFMVIFGVYERFSGEAKS